MKRATQGNLIGAATVIGLNGIAFWIVRSPAQVDAAAFFAGCCVALAVAVRLWSKPEVSGNTSTWWLIVATASALVGAVFFWIDIRLGFLDLPIPPEGVIAAMRNPFAVLFSIAFLPLFSSVAVGGAVRMLWLRCHALDAGNER
jgi:hypothetical protein